MLIKITDKCTMECNHCIERCTQDGKHMNMQVFGRTLEFIRKINPAKIIISGGEPTLHPNYFEIIEKLITEFGRSRIIVTSNGLFYMNEDGTINFKELEKYLQYGINYQITNDRRYYPIYVPSINHPLIHYVNELNHIYPGGRALDNNIKSYGCKAPRCFNIRSLCKKGADNFYHAVKILESKGKSCFPTILINGKIVLGEFKDCYVVGNVSSDLNSIYETAKTFKCNQCKMEDMLPPAYKVFINN